MATMSVAAFAISKGATPNQIKEGKFRMVKTLSGATYPALVVECGTGALFLTPSKKYQGQFDTCEKLAGWVKDHMGQDLRVAYGYDTTTHKDSYSLCLKGDDNAITIDLTNA